MDNKKLLTGFFKNPSSRVLKEGLLFCFCCIWSCSSQTEPANLSDICINTIVKKRIEQIVGKIVNRFFLIGFKTTIIFFIPSIHFIELDV